MHYVATSLGTDWPRKEQAVPIWFRALKRVVPVANPDIESLFPQVRCWWLEVDDAGVPQREVGLDATGTVVVAAPVDENMGFWTDSSMTFPPSEQNTVSLDDFESAWRAFVDRWDAAK
ncbi:hypothetical protein [Roseateles sp. P5_E7]